MQYQFSVKKISSNDFYLSSALANKISTHILFFVAMTKFFFFLSNSTSKIQAIHDLNDLKTFGYRGEALYNIISQSQSVTVTSKVENLSTIYEKKIESNTSRLCDITGQGKWVGPLHGTIVKVEKLFVKNKHLRRANTSRIDEHNFEIFLKALLLNFYSISLELYDMASNKLLFETIAEKTFTGKILSNFGHYYDLTNLKQYRFKLNSEFEIQVYLCKINGQVQGQIHHIYLNSFFLCYNHLYDYMNEVLKNNRVYFLILKIICPFSEYYLINDKYRYCAFFKNIDYVKKSIKAVLQTCLNTNDECNDVSKMIGPDMSFDYNLDFLESKVVKQFTENKSRRLTDDNNNSQVKKRKLNGQVEEDFEDYFCSWYDLHGDQDEMSTTMNSHSTPTSRNTSSTKNKSLIDQTCDSTQDSIGFRCLETLHQHNIDELGCINDTLSLGPKLWSNFMLPFNPRPRKMRNLKTTCSNTKYSNIETVLKDFNINLKWRQQNGILFSNNTIINETSIISILI